MHKEKTFYRNLTTAYGQFYISDGTKHIENMSNDYKFWSDRVYQFQNGHEIIVFIREYDFCKNKISVLKQRPTENILSIGSDHIVETSLCIETGKLVFTDCPTNSILFSTKVPNGEYRIRISMQNQSLSEEKRKEKDFYLIEIWPEKFKGTEVIKQFEEFTINLNK